MLKQCSNRGYNSRAVFLFTLLNYPVKIFVENFATPSKKGNSSRSQLWKQSTLASLAPKKTCRFPIFWTSSTELNLKTQYSSTNLLFLRNFFWKSFFRSHNIIINRKKYRISLIKQILQTQNSASIHLLNQSNLRE